MSLIKKDMVLLELTPNYYNKFKCIAERCKHNCCIGWEIDIDDETMQLYNSLVGETGEKIRDNIEGDVPHFVLQAGDRCPFLNKSSLCDIICEYGEDALCDICYLHPRFRNFYSSFEEIGLGLCCEEAARIILSEEEAFSISYPKDIVFLDEEKEFFGNRQDFFDILQNRSKNIGERFCELASAVGIRFDFSLKELCNTYLSLERLDEKWTKEIENLKDFSFDTKIFEDKSLQIFFEQLAIYFIFRHLKVSCSYIPVIKFTLMSCYLIGALCAFHKGENFEKMTDLVRMYSSEIEYSEENTKRLIYT